MAKVAVFAYGSLIDDPGQNLRCHITCKVDWKSPRPVEYARRSRSRGCALTLVFHNNGGIVQGKLLITDLENTQENTRQVREWVWLREGKPTCDSVKSECFSSDYPTVIFADLQPNIEIADLSAEKLACFAIQSVRQCPGRNGIAYLARNIQNDIITPLTECYKREILRQTGTTSLAEAERKIKAESCR
jgi:hypothetical protein